MLKSKESADDVAIDASPRLVADPEVVVRATRRRFKAEYKARVLREADQCKGPGEIGALLRREGLYASNLITWRRQREADGVAGLSRKRGRKADPESGSARKIAQLERTNERLAEKLRKAEFIIEFQKKMAILWATPSQGASEEND
jgi:transposase-like protein